MPSIMGDRWDQATAELGDFCRGQAEAQIRVQARRLSIDLKLAIAGGKPDLAELRRIVEEAFTCGRGTHDVEGGHELFLEIFRKQQ